MKVRRTTRGKGAGRPQRSRGRDGSGKCRSGSGLTKDAPSRSDTSIAQTRSRPAERLGGMHAVGPRRRGKLSGKGRRDSHGLRTPKPASRRARRRVPGLSRLQRLDGERQRAVDALLVQVYQHAAREMAELERTRVRELRHQDEEMEKRYAKARADLMRILRRGELPRPAG